MKNVRSKSKRRFIWVVGAMALMLCTGCAGHSRLALDYRHSYHLAKSNQILNPEAGKQLEPVTGLDGKAAINEYERYQASFAEPPALPEFSISIGGIK